MSKLSSEEVLAFWRLGMSLEARHVPEDELARALRESRVQYAFTTSNMGTKETYWALVSANTKPEAVGNDAVVLPPSRIVREVDWADRLDDGIDALWRPFWKEQQDLACSRIPADRLATFIAELGVFVAQFPERRRVERTKRLARAKDATTAFRIVLGGAKKSEVDATRFELLRIAVRLAR